MKLFVRSKEGIFAMAHDRKDIRSRSMFYREEIANHIMKCVVYSRSYRDYNHWINDELSVWVYNISEMKPRKGFKIKSSDYESWLFGAFGDEYSDARRDLSFFKDEFVKFNQDPFPDFEITSELCERLFHVVDQLKRLIVPKLGKYCSIQEVKHDFHTILDYSCKSSPWLK